MQTKRHSVTTGLWQQRQAGRIDLEETLQSSANALTHNERRSCSNPRCTWPAGMLGLPGTRCTAQRGIKGQLHALKLLASDFSGMDRHGPYHDWQILRIAARHDAARRHRNAFSCRLCRSLIGKLPFHCPAHVSSSATRCAPCPGLTPRSQTPGRKARGRQQTAPLSQGSEALEVLQSNEGQHCSQRRLAQIVHPGGVRRTHLGRWMAWSAGNA